MSSDFVAALAEQFGASEALIQRSADARAAASDSTAVAVLTEWTGGAPAPVAKAEMTPAPAVEPAAAPEPDEIEPVAVPQPAAEEPLPAEPTPKPIRPAVPPPIPVPETAPAGSLSALLLGALALFAVMFVASVVAPISNENAQSLDAVDPIVLSAEAVEGRDIYLAEGCASCHTQQVRPIVTDADLGIVTLSDSPLIPGLQRYGPDLTHVGSREPTDRAAWLSGFLADSAAFRVGSDHPSYSFLSDDDSSNLVAYLLESK